MTQRDQSGSSCCSNFHGTAKPTVNQFRKCGGCPVATRKIEEQKDKERKDK